MAAPKQAKEVAAALDATSARTCFLHTSYMSRVPRVVFVEKNLSCGDICPHYRLSCGEILHVTDCDVEDKSSNEKCEEDL